MKEKDTNIRAQTLKSHLMYKAPEPLKSNLLMYCQSCKVTSTQRCIRVEI